MPRAGLLWALVLILSGGLRYETQWDGAAVRLKMRMAEGALPMVFPWGSWNRLRWDFRLSGAVPLSIKVKGGAGTLDLNLRDLRVTELKMDGSLGTATLVIPARAGHTRAAIEGGVGTLSIRIPEGVAAHIQTSPGLGTITVNRERFPASGKQIYQSPNYDTAENRVDVRVEGGVGTVTVS